LFSYLITINVILCIEMIRELENFNPSVEPDMSLIKRAKWTEWSAGYVIQVADLDL